jgi:quinol monooxygenase YgiN
MVPFPMHLLVCRLQFHSNHMARNSNKVVALGAALARNIRAVPQVALEKRSTEPKWKPVKLALLVRLEARSGKEKALGDFLRANLSLVQTESATAAWFALRRSKSTFAVFVVFTEESGRQAHLTGALATLLKEQTRELLAKPPVIEKIDVLAAKLIDFQVTE